VYTSSRGDEQVKSLIRSWLGVEPDDAPGDQSTLRDLLDALDRMEPERARYLSRFAYLLGRVALADQTVSPEETRTMERLIEREGGIPTEQAVVVVGLAKTSNRLFGGTDNFLVAREFAEHASHEQKIALLRCLFAVSTAEGGISVVEEREIQRIARELRIEPSEMLPLRLEFRSQLPGLGDRSTP
jgi:uncharacterized tellurite resistance protein B-like protein